MILNMIFNGIPLAKKDIPDIVRKQEMGYRIKMKKKFDNLVLVIK